MNLRKPNRLCSALCLAIAWLSRRQWTETCRTRLMHIADYLFLYHGVPQRKADGLLHIVKMSYWITLGVLENIGWALREAFSWVFTTSSNSWLELAASSSKLITSSPKASPKLATSFNSASLELTTTFGNVGQLRPLLKPLLCHKPNNLRHELGQTFMAGPT